MNPKILFSTIAVPVCLWIISASAGAQTLTVTYPSASADTPPLSQLPDGPKPKGNTEHAHRPVPSHAGKGGGQDTAVQNSSGPLINAAGGTNFDGPGANGYAPSDSNIAVGPNHIFAVVNSVYQIFTKGGSSILGPKTLSSLWTGVGGGCATANAGDVVVQYDKLADRWILTELSSLSSPYGECIAVSKTNDPTGAYATYYYTFGSNLPDYPKFGVWPTATNGAYLATYNQFANAQSFVGAALCAYDRTAMLAGAASPAQICYTINDFSILPADLDGSTPPADTTPGYFLTYETLSSLRIWTLKPNFAVPSSSTLTQVTPDVSVTPFSELCGGGTCVPQLGTTNQLDSLGDRPMYRLAYRNFGGHQSLVFNHSVTSGVRWYELQSAVSPSAAFSVYQQGTYAPDATYRWMGSAAMDQAGDLAVGFSASSSSIDPAIRYSGRIPTDALGTLESEATMFSGTGAQTNGLSRWGDYSSLRIDPSDDCTFWYINEYLKSDGAFNWSTRIGSFKFSGCGGAPAPDFSIAATPSSQTVPNGTAAMYSVTTAALNGFSGTIALTVSGCPSGATCAFSPTSVAAGFGSTLTVTNAPDGTASLTVMGTSSPLSHSASPVSLTVSDFTISASPSSQSVATGVQASYTISTSAINGFSGSIALSANCPAGVTCSVSPTSVTPGQSATLTASSSTPGPYSLSVTGTSGSLLHTTTPVTLTVNAAGNDFSISSSASSLTIVRKSSGSVTIKLTALGSSSSVTLSVSGLPSKATATFTPNPAAASGSSTLKISTNPTTPRGTYTLTVTGNNGTFSHSVTPSILLTIN